jgi:inner membrane protease subunit 2
MVKFSLIKSFLIAGSIGITAVDTFAYIAPVDGSSMAPLINPNGNDDVLLLWRVPIKFNHLNRGDVVTLISPKNPDQLLIKRLIGLPGDVIKTISYKKRHVRIPAGHCWIEGDNHDKSYDSNSFGVVPIGLLVAKAGYIIWPTERLGKIYTEIPSKRELHPLYMDYNENESESSNNDEDGDDNDVSNKFEDLVLLNNSKFNENFDPLISFTDEKVSNNKTKMNYYVDFVSP